VIKDPPAAVQVRALGRGLKRQLLLQLKQKYPAHQAPQISVSTPNSSEAEQFIRAADPHIILARCKYILKPKIFSIARTGTFVFHPGICPEYRNAYGCFWALVNGEPEKVGMTLLRVDPGIDTGPVFGYFSYDFDPLSESSDVI
jgi:methionyl-tRNA formyltransferase